MTYKFTFGSCLLKLQNARDHDEVTFTDLNSWEIKDLRTRSIPFHKTIINRFVKGKNTTKDPFKALHLYQLSAPFREVEDYPFAGFNILEHKNVWIRQLKGYVSHPDIEEEAVKTDILPKKFYHILYQYYMITENEHWISEEAKVNVQLIHDLAMPSNYFYELKSMIDNLEETDEV